MSHTCLELVWSSGKCCVSWCIWIHWTDLSRHTKFCQERTQWLVKSNVLRVHSSFTSSAFVFNLCSVLQDDWQKEKRDFLQSLSRLSALPRTNSNAVSTGVTRPGQLTLTSSQVSVSPSSMELMPVANKPIVEKKASAYSEVTRNLNDARENGLPFKVSLHFFYCNVMTLAYSVKLFWPFCSFQIIWVIFIIVIDLHWI